jgi:beta-glucanase (GH16 family)
LSAPRSISTHGTRGGAASSASDGWGWNDPEADDYLHNPDPKRDRKNDRGGSIFTLRGIANIGCLVLLLLCLITLFAGYPIITEYTQRHQSNNGAFNLGGTNATGQVPLIPGFPSLIDPDTPLEAHSRVGHDGKGYELVFSDEFNKEGRTFYPGDDPFWTAVDFHYWPTVDLEWYHPSAITTENGHLKITMTQEPINDLQFKSGMLQSWNQMCFQWSYYFEISVSLPGNNRIGGFWPGVWTLGNLGRAGYGGTTDGLWPYTYTACDLGTLPNQTWPAGSGQTTPPGAMLTDDGEPLSYLPGQRLSSCTCKGEDHPGPNPSVGRGAPEVDVIEAQIDTRRRLGEMSQSAQVAPFDYNYQFDNSSEAVTIWATDITKWNTYLGGVYQQAVSGLVYVDSNTYTGTSGLFNIYGVEVFADKDDESKGYVTWVSGNEKSWTMGAKATGPNPLSGVSQRPITQEPMYLILNFGMSNGFQQVDLQNLEWPAHMLIDYVRVYQIPDYGYLGCDPEDHPTADYINSHPEPYNNPNITLWSQAGYTWPKNRLIDSC